MTELERQVGRITELRGCGWRFLSVGTKGVTNAIGARVWQGGWSDLLRVRVEIDVWASRTSPDRRVWAQEGDLDDVLDELCGLPAPAEVPSLWTPGPPDGYFASA